MKLISWNVNGLRSVLSKDFMSWFEGEAPDVLCLQETKLSSPEFRLDTDKYHQYFLNAKRKGYSGTAILSKVEPISVNYGIGIEEHDNEGRVITAEFKEFYLVCAYIPNSQRELLRLSYRQQWDLDFENYLAKLSTVKPVLLCGDLNVAHKECDIKNPKSNTHNAGFTAEERTDFQRLLDRGFTDSFRFKHPEEIKYSWWSYMFHAREKNVGWRIDYWIVSNSIKDKVIDSEILTEVMGSDHCPVKLEIAAEA